MKLRCLMVAGMLLVAVAQHSAAQPPGAPDGDLLKARPEIVEAWKDLRFGMFICWGPVTLTGLEIGWSRGEPTWGMRSGVRGGKGPTPAEVYDGLFKQWKPTQFNAREWVQVAKDAGARYLIFLVKHHDGFCLFDSQLTGYKSTAPESAWKVDVMKEIADACHAMNMKLIVYYSQPDWHHPDFCGDHHERYVAYLHGQIRELLTNYGRLDGLWFDGLGGTAKQWDAENLFKMARELQPWLIINNRCGLPGDYSTPEQQVGRFQQTPPWESCITLGTQWSWKPADKLKPYTDAIRMLVVCTTGGGNLALNTNPMPDGRIEPRQVESFRQIGAWLRKHGESIYGTRGGPFIAPDSGGRDLKAHGDRFALPGGQWWGGSTHRGNVIYLHLLRWPTNTVTLPAIKPRIVSHSVLTGGEAVVKQTDTGIRISVPTTQRDPLDTIVKLALDAPAASIPVLKPKNTAPVSLTTGKQATASNWFRNSDTYAPGKAVDANPDTRWGCDYGTHSCWLEVDLGETRTFDRAAISEPYGRVKAFELQVRADGVWKTFHRGTTIGENLDVHFSPVTGRQVRLNLLETTEGPSIWEFQLFAPVATKTLP